MICRAVAPICLILLTTASALAQAPTPSPVSPISETPASVPQAPAPQPGEAQSGRVFCEQHVAFSSPTAQRFPSTIGAI